MPGPSHSNPRTKRGPGRPTSSRTTRSRISSSAPSRTTPSSQVGERISRGLTFTRRILILVGVFAILALSYASSLRLYFAQRQQIADERHKIEVQSQRVSELQSQIEAWKDPDYIRSQARERLGWVTPGETGYVVIGADGKPVTGSSQAMRGLGEESRGQMPWWQKVTDTLQVADKPGPVNPTNTSTQKPRR